MLLTVFVLLCVQQGIKNCSLAIFLSYNIEYETYFYVKKWFERQFSYYKRIKRLNAMWPKIYCVFQKLKNFDFVIVFFSFRFIKVSRNRNALDREAIAQKGGGASHPVSGWNSRININLNHNWSAESYRGNYLKTGF